MKTQYGNNCKTNVCFPVIISLIYFYLFVLFHIYVLLGMAEQFSDKERPNVPISSLIKDYRVYGKYPSIFVKFNQLMFKREHAVRSQTPDRVATHRQGNKYVYIQCNCVVSSKES